MKRLSHYLMAFILLVSTTSCSVDKVIGAKGSGNVITEKRTIPDTFTSIKVQQGIQLYLSQEGNSLEVEADDNIMDLLKTEVKDDVLKIYFKENVRNVESKNVYLSTKANIKEISASSGASVQSEHTLDLPELSIKSTSGSSAKLQLVANTVKGSSSSGATIKLKGKAKSLSVSSSSGSNINASDFEVLTAEAKGSSGSSIRLNVTDNLHAKVSSGASIRYQGDPQVTKKTSSGGSVSKH